MLWANGNFAIKIKDIHGLLDAWCPYCSKYATAANSQRLKTLRQYLGGPSPYPLLGPEYALLGTIYQQFEVLGESWWGWDWRRAWVDAVKCFTSDRDVKAQESTQLLGKIGHHQSEQRYFLFAECCQPKPVSNCVPEWIPS